MLKSAMIDRIVSAMGGRVAEAITFGDISTGASQDIAHSSEIARAMVTKYGMSDVLGPVLYGKDNDEVFLGMDHSNAKNYSEAYANLIDDEVKRILGECYAKCEELLTVHNDKLTLIAETLIKKEKIGKDEFLKLMDENYDPTADESAEEEVITEDVDVEETCVSEVVENVTETDENTETSVETENTDVSEE